ncbi:MAG: type II secretion system protein [Rhizomicrobium sp.]
MTRTRRSRTGDEDGFTLLEILVALAILSVSLATLLGIFSMSLDRARQSEDEMAARTLAQSLIAQADAVANPRLGSTSGTAGKDFSWRLDLRPYGDTRVSGGTGLASIAASVGWNGSGGRRSLTLYSLRPVPRGAVP